MSGKTYDELNRWPKDIGCCGCPLHGIGASFARSDGSGRNGVGLLGEALGDSEAIAGKPFQGDAGMMLNRILHRGGLKREDFLIFNTICCHPPNNYLDDAPYEAAAIEHCGRYFEDTLSRHPEIKVIVPMGNIPLRKVLGFSGIKNFHGTVHWSERWRRWVVPTLHPSFILRTGTKEFPTGLFDITRALKVVRDGGFHQSPVEYILFPNVADFEAYILRYEAELQRDPDLILAADIETNFSSLLDEEEVLEKDQSQEIIRISFSYWPNTAITLPFISQFLPFVLRLLGSKGTKCFWNGNKFDVPRLQKAGVQVLGPILDGMDAWHVLRPDLPRGLGYVSPFFTDISPWKHLSNEQPEFYSAVDSDALIRIILKIREQMRNEGTWETFLKYYSGLEPRLQRMSEIGIGINEEVRREREDHYINIRDNTAKLIQPLVPDDLKPRLKAKDGGYKGKPKDVREYLKINGEMLDEGDAWRALGYQQFEYEDSETKEKVWRWDRVEDFNHNSSQQILRYIEYRYGKGAVPKDKRTGKPTTAGDELERLARQKKDEVLRLILDASNADSKITSFIKPWTPGTDGRVHGIFTNQPATSRLASQGPNCFSADTEVLTRRGWVLWPELTKDDLLAQFEPETKNISFEKPIFLHHYKTNESLIHIKSEQQLDLLVTGNHRCLLEKRKTGFYVESALTYPQDRKQYNAGHYVGGSLRLRRSQLILLAAIQADVSITPSGGWDVGFSKVRKQKRFLAAIQAEHIKFRLQESSRWRLHVKAVDVPDWAKNKKEFGPWILDLNKFCFYFLANEIWFWDGCFKHQSMYSSNIKRNTDWAQILSCLTGRRGKIREYITNGGNSNWQVDAAHKAYTWTTNTTAKIVSYDGFVYCASMPWSTLIVRRNGKVAITGNCQNFPRRDEESQLLRKMIVPGDGWEYLVSGDYRGIEAILVGHYAGDDDYKRIAFKGIHSFVAGRKLGLDIRLDMGDRDLDLALVEAKKLSNKTLVPGSVMSMYDAFKQTVHGGNYLEGALLLHKTYPELYPTTKSAQEYLDFYFGLFPKISKWQNEVIDQCYKTCYVQNAWRLKRWLFNAKKWVYDKRLDDWVLRPGDDAKKAIATIPQGSAGMIMRGALMSGAAQQLLDEGCLMITIHDDLTCRARNKQHRDKVMELLKQAMEYPVKELDNLVIPIEIKVGRDWGSMQSI